MTIRDFPLSVTDFKHRIEIYDEDGSILTLKSREQILEEIEQLDLENQLKLEIQLRKEYLLWITLTSSKPIFPSDTRLIRFVYHYTGEIKFEKLSLFSFPNYILKGKAGSFPLSIQVKCPKDLQLTLNTRQTCAYRDEDISRYNQDYGIYSADLCSYGIDLINQVKPLSVPNLPLNEADRVFIFNKDNLISCVIPSGMKSIQYSLSFSIQISKAAQLRWKVGILGSILSISLIIILQEIYPPILLDKSAILIGLGTASITLIGSIITLSKSSLLTKTRIYLTIPIFLSILLISFQSKTKRYFSFHQIMVPWNDELILIRLIIHQLYPPLTKRSLNLILPIGILNF